MINLKVMKLHEEASLPHYATPGAACFDLYACLPNNDAAISTLAPATAVIPTGLAFAVPEDHVMLVFSRSGQGFKEGIRLANCVGVIDSDYRGELMVKLTRDEPGSLFITHGARIAQAMILPLPLVMMTEVDELDETERGTGGFGSTGQ